jgi:hypothetical protein
MNSGAILLLSALVVLVLVLRAAQSLRHTRGTERGSLPGHGHHVIRAEYMSGGGGGGHFASYEIPKDPQEYARRFVPRDRTRPSPAKKDNSK